MAKRNSRRSVSPRPGAIVKAMFMGTSAGLEGDEVDKRAFGQPVGVRGKKEDAVGGGQPGDPGGLHGGFEIDHLAPKAVEADAPCGPQFAAPGLRRMLDAVMAWRLAG